MDRPTLDMTDIFRRYAEAYRREAGASLSTAQRRVMTAIETCRTAALGGHVDQCDACGHQRIAYNSCANRHCPKCQSLARAAWIERRTAELLDCEYFHECRCSCHRSLSQFGNAVVRTAGPRAFRDPVFALGQSDAG